jgi:ATP-dependent DNA ligase
VIADGRADLRSRRAVDLGPWFPELTHPPAALIGRTGVLDGEIVVLRVAGPPA